MNEQTKHSFGSSVVLVASFLGRLGSFNSLGGSVALVAEVALVVQ
jgi:hypothetical protein